VRRRGEAILKGGGRRNPGVDVSLRRRYVNSMIGSGCRTGSVRTIGTCAVVACGQAGGASSVSASRMNALARIVR
jgi:hypothetical protein